MMTDMRIGAGFDVHAFAKDRRLVLGGVTIDYPLGLAGHSDADVLTHAVMDALLGACALRDIGCHFPDTDARYKGADSLALLSHCVHLLAKEGFCVGNVDATVIAQEPKIAPYIDAMRENLARAMCVDVSRVSVKATTTEHLGFTGRKEGVAAQAAALVTREK